MRIEALRSARIGRGSYLCNKCRGLFGPKEVQVNHVVSVTPPAFDGKNWTEYVARLFCEVGGLRILCKPCHSEITKEQRKAKTNARPKRAQNNA